MSNKEKSRNMWWFLFKAGLVICLLVIVFFIFASLLGQNFMTSSLNNKLEGDIRDRPDVVVQSLESVKVEDVQPNEAEELDAGYLSD